MEIQDSFSSFDGPQNPPANNLALAIIGAFLGLFSPCCLGLILGIIAIVFSSQVNTKFMAGDHIGAQISAKNAKTMSYIAIALGIIGVIMLIVTISRFGGIDGYMEMIRDLMEEMGE